MRGVGLLFGLFVGLRLRCKLFSAWIEWLCGLRLRYKLFSACCRLAIWPEAPV